MLQFPRPARGVSQAVSPAPARKRLLDPRPHVQRQRIVVVMPAYSAARTLQTAYDEVMSDDLIV
jgi:hypothetical protein